MDCQAVARVRNYKNPMSVQDCIRNLRIKGLVPSAWVAHNANPNWEPFKRIIAFDSDVPEGGGDEGQVEEEEQERSQEPTPLISLTMEELQAKAEVFKEMVEDANAKSEIL